jgi:hypothetical protein
VKDIIITVLNVVGNCILILLIFTTVKNRLVRCRFPIHHDKKCESMKYTEALETVEHWLHAKHIRLFCRSACGGKCCYPQCDVNHLCERPPLLCAMYLCSDVRNIVFGFHNGDKYVEITQKINKVVTDVGFDSIKMKDTYPDFDIPDGLITSLLSVEFKEDIHYKSNWIKDGVCKNDGPFTKENKP